MNVTICIIIGIIALIVGFVLGRSSVEPTFSLELIEKINFAIGTENKTLKEENETLKKKNVFFKEWFVRSYIEQYYRKKLALDDHQIYTSDALENLKCYAIAALNNFDKTWNYEACNEQCTWIKEYLEELISKIDSILDDKFSRDVIDRENEDAFRRFFIAVETSMFFDRIAKENGSKLEKLTYREPAVEHDDLC
jgi:hypothetical protein